MTQIHKVSLEFLRKIEASYRFDPYDLPVAVDQDLMSRGLIERYGRGRNRLVRLTDAGRAVLDSNPVGASSNMESEDTTMKTTPASRKPAHVKIPLDAWAPVGGPEDPQAELLATLVIQVGQRSTSMHLSAYAVDESEHVQEGATEAVESELETLRAAHDCERMETLDIGGRSYVLFAHGYND